MGVVSGFNHENGWAVLSGKGREVTLWMAFLPHHIGGRPAGRAGLLALSLCGAEKTGRERRYPVNELHVSAGTRAGSSSEMTQASGAGSQDTE